MTPAETKIADDLLATIGHAAAYVESLYAKGPSPEPPVHHEEYQHARSLLAERMDAYSHFLQACEARERLMPARIPDVFPVGLTGISTPESRLAPSSNPNHEYTCRDCGKILPSVAQAMIREFGGTLSCGECTAAGKGASFR